MRTGYFQLAARDRPALTRHLLALNPEDRRLRFFYVATDEQIRTFVSTLAIEHSLGYFVDDVLVATAMMTPEGPRCVEFSVSVDEQQRRRGLAAQLLAYGLQRVNARQVDRLVIHHLAENAAMAAVHHHLPSRRERNGGEIDVAIDLRALREAQPGAAALP
ncbi:MAG: GNAT family N-acetyltransferase [Rubrivivax sp.]|nr:MAG: GNAT family N-acetyltransferase [Rubrivivax sp.]